MTPGDNAGTLFMQSFLTAQTLKRFAVCGLIFLVFFSALPVSVLGVNGEIPPAPPTAPSPPTAPTPTPPPQTDNANQGGGGGGGDEADDCHILDAFGPRLLECLGTWTAGLLTGLNIGLAFILYVVGVIFDFTLQYSIHGTTAPNPEDPGGIYRSGAIVTAWHLLRDIINLALIFILLYVAIGTVLNIQSIDWRKQVAQIIIAAIFVNFSLFLTRIVIDAGNIVAFNFHQQLTTIERENEPTVQVGISERFMGILGIPRIRGLEEANAVQEGIDGVTRGWMGAAMAFMRLLVTAVAIWVFFSAAILFIGRTLALFLLLILSPIGVAGASLPLLGPHAAKWRSTLFGQAFLPAIFLFLVLIVLLFFDEESANILASAGNQLGLEGGDSLLLARDPTANESPEALFILYILVAAALIMVIKITKDLSGEVGKMTNVAFSKALGFAGGAAGLGLGAGALLGRKVIGESAQAFLQSQKGKDLLENTTSSNFATRSLARAGFSVLNRAQTSSFDPRTIKTLGVGDRLTKRLGTVGRKEGGREADVKKATERMKDDPRYKKMTPEQLKQEAELHEKTWWLPGKGISLAKAKELNEMARRRQTSSEDREKRIGGAAKNIESNLNNPRELRKILGNLNPGELPLLPPEILTKKQVIRRLKIGDLQGMKGKINIATRDAIAAEIRRNPKIDKKVKDYINTAESGFL